MLAPLLQQGGEGCEGGGNAGICFLLRWSLDHAASEGARAGAAGGMSTYAVLIGECLRAMANLICDDLGEVKCMTKNCPPCLNSPLGLLGNRLEVLLEGEKGFNDVLISTPAVEPPDFLEPPISCAVRG